MIQRATLNKLLARNGAMGGLYLQASTRGFTPEFGNWDMSDPPRTYNVAEGFPMADPQTSWPRTETQPVGLPPLRWVRWLIAGLILLTLAFIFHTTGRFARLAAVETRHWMTTTTRIPRGLASGVMAKFLGIRATGAVSSAPPGWLPPIGHAQLKEGFGWHGSGAKAQFEPGVVLQVSLKSPVLAGVKGHVAAIQGQSVDVLSDGYDVRIFPLKISGRLNPGAAVTPTMAIGVSRSSALTIEVTRRGYPVNPLSSELYGSRWIRR